MEITINPTQTLINLTNTFYYLYKIVYSKTNKKLSRDTAISLNGLFPGIINTSKYHNTYKYMDFNQY